MVVVVVMVIVVVVLVLVLALVGVIEVVVVVTVLPVVLIDCRGVEVTTRKTTIPAEFKLCQMEEIVIIQVRGERVFIENRLDIKRQSDQRKQQVNGVKCVQKIAQESEKGSQNRQNTTRGTRKRTIKGISKK